MTITSQNFTLFTFTKKYPKLFDNQLLDLQYRIFQYEKDTDFDTEESILEEAYQVYLTPEESKNIYKYSNKLIKHKEKTAKKVGRDLTYNHKLPYYYQGFLAEYAFVKLGLFLGLNLQWNCALRDYNQGDDGDTWTEINQKKIIIDIKSKDYKEAEEINYKILHYDITGKPEKMADYFVFCYVHHQEDGSTIVDILGFHSKEKIKTIKETEEWSRKRKTYPYKARRVKYPTINPIQDLFKIF